MQRQVYHEIYYRLDEAVDSLVAEKELDPVRADELMQIINNWLDEKEDEDKQAVDGWWKFQKLWNRDGLDSAMKFVRDGGMSEQTGFEQRKQFEQELHSNKIPVMGNEADQGEAMEKAGVIFSDEKLEGIVL